MKISTRGRYALRLMLEIAMSVDNTPVSIKEIAVKQGISDKYLEQIISVLNKAGYVKSIRGAQGGYVLKTDPEKCTVGMILRLTEGSLSPVQCLEDGEPRCDRIDKCATIEVWKRLDAAISSVVDNITLSDLVELQKKKEQELIDDYYAKDI